MRFFGKTAQLCVLIGAGIFLSACNPATKGWSSAKGESVSFGRLVAVKQDCGYPRARERAIRLLESGGNRHRNEQRAARIMSKAEGCMRRYGIKYRKSAYGIGHLKSR